MSSNGKSRFRIAFCLAGVVLQATAAGTLGAPTDLPQVPTGHPRVYVRPDDLAAIQAKLRLPEFSAAWAVVKGSSHPFCRAFVYLTTGEKRQGRLAVTGALRELEKCTDTRTPADAMHWGACVYDWCYDLLSTQEKDRYLAEFERIAGSHEPGYPADPASQAIVGHGTEGWLLTYQLPAGLAIYDESPRMFDAAERLFFAKFVPVRNFFYPAHMHHQGDSYIVTRFQHDLLASWMFRRMGAGDVFTRQQQYVAYQLLYHLRPDGQQLRSGDTYDDDGRSDSKQRLMLLAGAYYDDPYLLEMADSDFYGRPSLYERVCELLFRQPGMAKRPLQELPLSKYFPAPMGEMIARTGWRMGMESRDAVVHMRIGEYFFGNHQRKDFGTFQIYYRGPLAIASGLYEGRGQPYGSAHWLNYHHQTVAHNGLLILDPSEAMANGSVNDGGQRWPSKGADHPTDLSVLLENDYRMGRVTAHDMGPDPARPLYSYLAGDITRAYASSKVETVTRSMVTFNTGNSLWPCILIVWDRVVSADPSFKKTWLLHSIQEPAVEGRTVTIVRTGKPYTGNGQYGGKLVVESLLPPQATITKVGGPGKEFWIESAQTNFATSKGGAAEAGSWRVEISPDVPSRADVFLHVLSVMDDTAPKGPAVRQIASGNLIGVQVLDSAVLFSRNGELQTNADFRFENPTRVLLCDLAPGSRSVTKDGTHFATAQATNDGRCVFFEAGSGTYHLEASSGSE
jgi:heparin/heparan-sulfate lyase